MIGIIVDHVGCDDHLLVIIGGVDQASIVITSVVAILDDLLIVVADLVVIDIDDLLTDLLAIGVDNLLTDIAALIVIGVDDMFIDVDDAIRDSEVGCGGESCDTEFGDTTSKFEFRLLPTLVLD